MNYINFEYDENQRLSDIDDSQMGLLFINLISKAYEMNGQSKDGKEILAVYNQMLYVLRKRFNYMYLSWIIKAFENGNESDDRLCPKAFIKWLIVSNRQLEDSRKSGIDFSDKKNKDEEKYAKPNLVKGYNVYALAYMLRSVYEPGKETISFDERVDAIEKGINPYTLKPLNIDMIKSWFKKDSDKRMKIPTTNSHV
jgi:hypothetical protein